jgi:hypothetical protein
MICKKSKSTIRSRRIMLRGLNKKVLLSRFKRILLPIVNYNKKIGMTQFRLLVQEEFKVL